MKKIFYILILGLLTSACSEIEPEEIVVDNFIDDELSQYFESFKEEAAMFDIDVNYADLRIDGYLQNIPERGVAGQCQRFEGGLSAVIVEPAFWNSIDGLEREFLVYHELGHCVLGREHTNEAAPNGVCRSIMTSGSPDCRINYISTTRADYLTELFTNL